MEPPSIISHVSIGTNDFARATAFYDSIMPVIGAKRVFEHPEGDAVAYGRQFPEFWVQTPINGEAATVGNGTHFSFLVPSKALVDAFFEAAINNGANSEGEPGDRPHYGEPYYGCFVRDPDGHKVEANYWDMDLAKKLGMG